MTGSLLRECAAADTAYPKPNTPRVACRPTSGESASERASMDNSIRKHVVLASASLIDARALISSLLTQAEKASLAIDQLNAVLRSDTLTESHSLTRDVAEELGRLENIILDAQHDLDQVIA